VSIGFHRLPAAHLGALAAGGGGPEAIGLLCRSQYSKHVLLLRGIAIASPAAAAAYDLLARAQRHDAVAAAAVARYPAVGAWAYRTTMALRGDLRLPGATPDGLGAVAAAAAIRAGLTAEIDVPARDGLVVLPSLGAVLTHGTGMTTVRVSTDGAEVRYDGGCVAIPPDYRAKAPGWRPLRPLLTDVETAEIMLDDADPFRMPPARDLAPAPDLSRWRPVFAQAWTLLRQYHAAVAAEVAAMITAVVPLARPSRGHASSSSPEAFGAVAMAEPPDPVELALTLTHEAQHMKLSAVLDLVPLIGPDDGSRYYAPWREDPRPAGGLLQGAYAFLGVTGFWRRQRQVPAADPAAAAEFARWRAATAHGCRVLLASGQLTGPGERFVQAMARTLRPWCAEPVPDKAQRMADEASEQHIACWQAAYGPVPRPSDLR